MSIKHYWYWLSAIVSSILLSWIGFAHPEAMPYFFATAVLVSAALAFWKLEFGVAIVLAELIVGSFGYVLFWASPIGTVSFRIALFGVLLLAWAWRVYRDKHMHVLYISSWKWWVAFAVVLAASIALGLVHGNALGSVLGDANGYVFFALLLPVSQLLYKKEEDDSKHALVMYFYAPVLAALSALLLTTIAIEFLFSHAAVFQHYLPAIYQWIRDFRIGEITLRPNGFYRVFFQSHFYAVVAYAVFLIMYLRSPRWWLLACIFFSEFLVFISYSRSFALSAITITFVIFAYSMWVYRVSLGAICKSAALVVLSAAGVYVAVLGLVNVPLPSGSGSGVGAVDLLSERTQNATTEAAGSSRIALLKPLAKASLHYPLLGSGFGTEVTFCSSDPRIVEEFGDACLNDPAAEGNRTTAAFEWGYLDLLLKIGIVGLLTFGVLIWGYVQRAHVFMRKTAKASKNEEVGFASTAVFSALAAIAVVLGTHVLTPYVNHPLGIGALVCAAILIELFSVSKVER